MFGNLGFKVKRIMSVYYRGKYGDKGKESVSRLV